MELFLEMPQTQMTSSLHPINRSLVIQQKTIRRMSSWLLEWIIISEINQACPKNSHNCNRLIHKISSSLIPGENKNLLVIVLHKESTATGTMEIKDNQETTSIINNNNNKTLNSSLKSLTIY